VVKVGVGFGLGLPRQGYECGPVCVALFVSVWGALCI